MYVVYLYCYRPAGGILPTDSVALEKRSKLRQQRQSEYMDYIKRREGIDSVSKVRTELSAERDAELAKNRAALGSRRKHIEEETGSTLGRSRSNYNSVRANAFTQERQYTSGSLGYDEPVEKYREPAFKNRKVQDSSVQMKLNYVTPHFDNVPSPPLQQTNHGAREERYTKERKAWDEDERDLMQWTQNKAKGWHQKLRTESLEVGRDSSKGSPASAKPLPGWGKSQSAEQKEHRQKQKKYAEELHQQMKEKRHGGRSRDEVYYGGDIGEGSRYKGGLRPVIVPGSRSRDRGVVDEPNPTRVRERPSVPEPKHIEDDIGRHKNPSRHEESSYNAKYPPYPYPVPPHYQYPPGGVPWPPHHHPPPPPSFAYPYSQYRPDQDHNLGPYYQPYYFSPPNNAPPPQSYHGPVPSVVYPYNAPPPPGDDSRDLLDPNSYRDRHPVPDRGRPAREQSSPPNLYRQQKNEKPKSFEFGTDRVHAQGKQEYRLQLEEQVREKKTREFEEKLAKIKYDTRKSTEIYDPFGKGGCGAPVRDQHGNLVADLKKMRKINENRLSNNSVKFRPSSVGRTESKRSSRLEAAKSDSPEKSGQLQHQEQTILTYTGSEDVKKTAQENYRDYLRQQVLEKEKLKKEEKEKERLEELKQLEQVEKERKKMQEEYQQEQERQRKKEEELRKKNETIKLEAESERQRVLMQRQLEAEKEEIKQRKIADRELQKKIASPRRMEPSRSRAMWSPPVPALKHLGTLGSGPIPRAETFTEAPLLSKFHADVPIRRSNDHYPANSTSDDYDDRNPPAAFHYAPRNISSPPVPALQKKMANREVPRQESSEQTTNGRNLKSEVDDIPRLSRNHVELNHVDHSGVTGKQSQRQESQRNTEILTKLGAIRLYLQEELAKQRQLEQQSEASPEIIERVKQQRPKLAMPTRSKVSSNMNKIQQITTQRNQQNERAGRYDSSFSIPVSGSLSEFKVGSNSSRNDTYRRLGKENMSDVPHLKPDSNSILTEGAGGGLREPASGIPSSSSLLNKKATSNATGRPWRVGVLAQPSSKFGSSSALRVDSAVEAAPSYRGRRPTSPSTLSKFSVSTSVIDNMEERTGERMRRLDAIINSRGFDETSLDGQSIDSSSLAVRPARQEQDRKGGGSNGQYGQPSHALLTRAQRFPPEPSRHSEHSLECDTRHLPIN